MGAFYGQETRRNLKQRDLHSAQAQRGRDHRILLRSNLHLDSNKDRAKIIEAGILKATRNIERREHFPQQGAYVHTRWPAKIKPAVLFTIDQMTARLVECLAYIDFSFKALHDLFRYRLYPFIPISLRIGRVTVNPSKATNRP